MWRSRWRYGLATFDFHRGKFLRAYPSTESRLSLLRWPGLQLSLRSAGSWCFAPLVCKGSVLSGWDGSEAVLCSSQVNKGSNSSGCRKRFWWGSSWFGSCRSPKDVFQERSRLGGDRCRKVRKEESELRASWASSRKREIPISPGRTLDALSPEACTCTDTHGLRTGMEEKFLSSHWAGAIISQQRAPVLRPVCAFVTFNPPLFSLFVSHSATRRRGESVFSRGTSKAPQRAAVWSGFQK